MRRKSSMHFILFIPAVFMMLSFGGAKKMTWVAIGDSITYLNDHPDETGYRTGKGYLTMVKEAIADIDYINQGHNGWTTSGIAKEIEKLGIVKADIYTVFIGTNDWWSGIPVGTLNDYLNDTGTGTTCGAYRKIINKIRSLNPEARIVLITPMQRNDFVYLVNAQNNAFGSYKEKNGQTLESFADAVITIGKQEKLEWIDLYHDKKLKLDKLVKYKRLRDPVTGKYRKYKFPESAAVPFNPVTDEYPYPLDAMAMTYDGLHPSENGNAVISGYLVKLFKKH